MTQFTVYKNINEETMEAVPYLVDVQNDLLEDLDTRVVIPMCPSNALGNKPISRLSPSFDIKGGSYMVLTPQLAGIPISELGDPVCDLSAFRDQFINALDFLVVGF